MNRAPSEDPIQLCRRLVQTPSVNPELEAGGGGEARIARLIEGWLKGWGCAVQRTPVASGRHNVLTRVDGRSCGPALLLAGHLDTVGVQGMRDPFSGEIRGGRLYGRGAADMKSGIACGLSLIATLAQSPPKRGSVTLALTADEEHASIGMRALLREGLKADAAVVLEPTSLEVMPAHKGFLWAEIATRGVAAHGSRPDIGVDAIAAMGTILEEIGREDARLADSPAHPLLGRPSIHAGTIRGGSAPSVYPDRCVLVVERRTLPGERQEDICKELNEMVGRAERRLAPPAADVRLRSGLRRSASEVSADSGLVRALLSAAEEVGQPTRVGGMSAWVEASYLNEAGIPAVCMGPGSIARAHAAREWVCVKEVARCAEILRCLVDRFLG